jgi:hypothetical protein
MTWGDPGKALLSSLDTGARWDLAADSKGGLLVTWEEAGHVSAQRFSPDGKSLWTRKTEALSASEATQRLPTLAPDGAGGVYVVWEERLAPGQGGAVERWVLFAQHVNELGAPLWTANGSRVSLRPSDQRMPHAVYDGSAGVIVAWKDFRESASQLQVQRLNYQGNRLWGLEGIVLTAPAGDPARSPYLAAVGGGSGVFAWQASSAGSDRLFLQLVNASGKVVWSPQGSELDHGNWHEWNPVLHGDGQGGTWVGWEDYRNSLNWVIFIKHMHVTGASGWSGGEATVTTVQADQGRLDMTDDGQGGILAAWIDNRYGSIGLYLQEIDRNGKARLGTEGMTVATALVNPRRPEIVSLAPGQAGIAWVDTPAKGTWTLYWQVVGPLKPINNGAAPASAASGPITQ